MKNLTLSTTSRLFAVAGLFAILSACGGGSGGTGDVATVSASTGTLTLGITDAPVDSAGKVVVRFTGVELLPPEGGTGSSKTFTFTTPKTIDLLSLQGGLRDNLLNGEEIPAGRYGQIRLIVQAEHDNVMDSYITINGAQHELRVPSGNQTGLKLVHNFNIESGSATDYTIDFDLRKSVVFSPGQGYLLKPVLRLVETVRAGKISGTIAPSVYAGQTCSGDPLVGYAVYAYPGAGVTADDLGSPTAPLATTGVKLNESSQYIYTMAFLAPGDYTIVTTCQANLDNPEANDNTVIFVAATNITVVAGTTTTHNFQ